MDPVDFTPIPQCQIPPVIHSVYIPNKPRQKVQSGPPQRLDSRADLLSRQHSYNQADYELQKRVKIQQRAQSQLISENPHLEALLTPHHTTTSLSKQQSTQSTNTTLPTPGLINTTDSTPANTTTTPNQQPQRRAFGEMMRDGGFSTRTGPQGNTTTNPTQQHPISKSIDNLHNDELSDSDSFVMIEDTIPGHHHTTKKQTKSDTKDKTTSNNKGYTINENGVKIWDNKKPPLGSNHKSLLCANVLHTSNGVDLSLVEPGHHTCLMVIDIIKHMQRGISVIKHGRRGKPRTCLLKLAQNCRSFTWASKNKDDGENVIRFQWITAITQGQTSTVFQRNLDPRVEPLSLTMLYTKPEKYTHIDESDDDDDSKTDTKTSFLPSFFSKKDKDGNKITSNTGKHSSWKGINQDHTLDVIIEDPNDWLIWYNGCKILIDMANTKLIIDESTKLCRKTIIQLSLPILSDYPSTAWLVDATNGLSVAESIENEKQHEHNQVQVQLALTRKETFKELIRRTSSYNDGSEMQNIVRQQLLQRHESQRLQRQNTQLSINNSQPSTSINFNAPPLTTQQSTTLLNGDTNNDSIDLLSDSFPSPWRTIEIIGSSHIVHQSWLQQLIYFGPKNGRSSPWACAYTMSTTAATYQRVLERIASTPKEILGFEGKDKEILTQQEQIRRERLYKSHIQNCGSLSIIILRSKQGDILGGYATGSWCEKWGFYGSPDSYVFSIGQEEVTMALPDGIDTSLVPKQDDSITPTSTTLTTNTTTPISKQPKVLENGHVVLDEKIYQMHIYRWCGNGRFFQFVSQDAFGFGGNITDDQDTTTNTDQITNGDKNNNNTTNTTTQSTTVGDTLPLQIGNGAMQSTGPALTLSRTLDIGYSLPCPIFQSPQLTKSKQWTALQMEVWIPVPKL